MTAPATAVIDPIYAALNGAIDPAKRERLEARREFMLGRVQWTGGKRAQLTREAICGLVTEALPGLQEHEAQKVFYSLLARRQLVYDPDYRIGIALYSLPR